MTKDGDAIKAYVYNLKTKSLTILMSVSEVKKKNAVFPDFLPNGNVLVMKVQKTYEGVAHGTLFENVLGSGLGDLVMQYVGWTEHSDTR